MLVPNKPGYQTDLLPFLNVTRSVQDGGRHGFNHKRFPLQARTLSQCYHYL